MKLYLKLALLFSSIMLFITLAAGHYFYTRSFNLLESRIKTQLENLALNSLDKVDNNFSECFRDIKILASDPLLFSGKATPSEITKRLVQYKEDYTVYSSFSFFDLNRVRIADTTGKDIGKKHELVSYWEDIERGEEFSFGLSKPESLKSFMFHFAFVVKDGEGMPSGVVVARIPIELIEENTEQVTSHIITEKYKIDLVDMDGILLYSNYNYAGIIREKLNNWDEIKKNIDSGSLVYSGEYLTGKNEKEIFAYASKGSDSSDAWRGITLVIRLPFDTAFSSVFKLRNEMFISLAVIVIISVFVIVFFLSGITKPLETLSHAAESVSRGNLDISVDIRSKDEIGVLAESFNSMVGKLKESQRNMLVYSKDLELRVAGRTKELEQINKKMEKELAERGQIEKTLRESEDRFRIFMNNNPAIAWMKNKDFQYVYVNLPMERLFNRKLKEWEGKTDFDFWPEPQAKELRDNDTEVLETWKPIETIEEVQTPDGTIRQWQVLKFPLKDSLGNSYVGGIAVDTTTRIEAEELLRRNSEQMSLIFESLPVIVYTAKAKGDFGLTYISSNVRDITGYMPEEFLQNTDFWIENIYPDDKEKVRNSFRKLFEKGMYESEYRLRVAGGEYKWFLDTMRLVNTGSSADMYILGVGVDVTSRKQNEEALQRATGELEKRVAERTDDLKKAYSKLKESTDQLAEKNREIDILSQMTDLLQSANSLDEAYDVIRQSLQNLFDENEGCLYILNPSRNILKADIVWGNPKIEEAFFSPDECWALRRGRLHRCTGDAYSLKCKHMGGESKNYLCIPLIAHGDVLGVIQILLTQSEGRDIDDEHVEAKEELLVYASERISMALANLRLRETLRNLAIRDPLTGLFNRRFMEESLEREKIRCERKGSSLGIVMMDIDEFKFFNDTYGHDVGDMMLRKMGEFLKKNIRSSDIACRYGGEEFLIIMNEATLEITKERAEFLRNAVKQVQVQCTVQQSAFITLSFGIAVYPLHSENTEILLNLADKALYKAKHEGRDRVCIAEPV